MFLKIEISLYDTVLLRNMDEYFRNIIFRSKRSKFDLANLVGRTARIHKNDRYDMNMKRLYQAYMGANSFQKFRYRSLFGKMPGEGEKKKRKKKKKKKQ